MVERFFFGVDDDQNQTALKQSSDHLLLLSGPPSSGKSSLLFQFAYNCALHAGNATVVFICSRRKFETKTPCLSQVRTHHQTSLLYLPFSDYSSISLQGIDPSSRVLQRIHMKYVDDDEGIKNYFAAFHLHDKCPVSVVIDDFADFFDERKCQNRYGNSRGRDLAMVKTLALCRDAIAHANEAAAPCRLLLSDTHHGDSPRLLYLYKRWLSSIYTIKGDGSGSFLLMNSYKSPGIQKSRSTKVAKYSIALQYLILEGISKDEQLCI